MNAFFRGLAVVTVLAGFGFAMGFVVPNTSTVNAALFAIVVSGLVTAGVAFGPTAIRRARAATGALDVGDLIGALVFAPLVGLTITPVLHGDPRGTAFYETAAQVGAGLLIAFAVEAGGRLTGTARETRAVHLGLATGICLALGASLTAVARAHGSEILFGLTIGGLISGALFLVAATLPQERARS